MTNLRNAFIIAAAGIVAGAFLASPELRAYAVATITSADIVDGTIQSVDIGSGQVKSSDIGGSAVTSAKIKDGAVKAADIGDGEITSSEIASSFIVHRTLLDDAAGNAAGWDPDGSFLNFFISDPAFDATNSVVVLNVNDALEFNTCTVDFRDATADPDVFEINCVVDDFGTTAPSNGSVLDYVIINAPATPIPSSAAASSSAAPEDRERRTQ